MGYIEKNLMEGEQKIHEARQHWIIYWKPFLLLLIAIGLFAIPTKDMALLMQICMSLVLIFVASIWAINIYGGRKYVLTNRRIILKRGILRRQSTDLVLRRCEGVSISQSVFGRIFGYGDVDVSTGEVTNHFQHIENPVRFSTLINQQIAQNVVTATDL
ncbi:MAG: PH domain-containing protein [Prevotella sp.]|nr:PH domain-containing protein [Prevotella sp.]